MPPTPTPHLTPQMDAAGVAADAVTCNTLLSLCARVRDMPTLVPGYVTGGT
jgi:hypothetical protein